MQKFIPFDSYSETYKYPFGSVGTGTDIHFSVNFPRDMGVSSVRLIIYNEFDGNNLYYDLYWRSTDNITEWWECNFKPLQPGLYFYYFEYTVSWGTGKIFLDSAGKGCFSGSDRRWQLTVYDNSFKTPDWLKGGVIYQIFPDRFCFSGSEKKNIPSGRVLRHDTENLPEYRPDKNGKILNNDFFCGDLKGIEEKLGYIKSLGVTCIYLNPVFEAHSNHRYDTSDYLNIDPVLGTEQDFISLCQKAKQMGMYVIFDGVFSHTGDDSIYFNKYKRYGNGGAYNDENSKYRSWYSFGKTRDEYASWWGIDILPEVNENDPSFTEFITGENGVIDKWLKNGAMGIRLDVADELPDEFLDCVRKAVKRNGSENFILGEVWEDATNKFSWGVRRRYLLGNQLDSVMNYPFREAIISFVKTKDAEIFMNKIMSIVDNYPPEALNTAMNHLGTHDTERILTALSDVDLQGLDRERQASVVLDPYQRKIAEQRVKAAAVLQYTLPGVPSLYYADEAAAEGAKDPFNRCFYPWGKENTDMIDYFRFLGNLRKNSSVFKNGKFIPLSAVMQCVAFIREKGSEKIAVISNMNDHEINYYINYKYSEAFPVFNCTGDKHGITVPPVTTAVVKLYD